MKTGLSLVALVGMAGGAWGQSLLGEGGGSPYDPPKPPALKKHDHLQVLVQDRSRPAETRSGRRAPAQLLEEWTRADAASAAERSFTIAAEVIDLRPNGTLVIQAMKRRRVNAEEEVIKLTGEVPASAVARRTVLFDDVANPNMVYEGKGAGGQAKPPGSLGGWLPRIWPF